MVDLLEHLSEICKVSSPFAQWAGFERPPQGRLLSQVIDISGSMGFAYERSIRFRKDFHVHERHMLVCPRGSTRMAVRTKTPASAFVVDGRSVLFVPRDLEHDDESLTTVYDTVALFPSDHLLDAVCGELSFEQSARGEVFDGARQMSRGPWLKQLIEQFFRRRMTGQRNELLEHEIAGEVVRALVRELENVQQVEHNPKDLQEHKHKHKHEDQHEYRHEYQPKHEHRHEYVHKHDRERGPRGVHGHRSEETPPRDGGGRDELLRALALEDAQRDPILRALEYIEANIFDDLDLRDIARQARMSSSSLLRHFRRLAGLAPYQYVRIRRLDEARLLLESGMHQIQEVALLVGYETAPAFSKAFKLRFGKTPSACLTRR